jgi:hypothetical protein
MSAMDASDEWIDITGDGGVLKKILKEGSGTEWSSQQQVDALIRNNACIN